MQRNYIFIVLAVLFLLILVAGKKSQNMQSMQQQQTPPQKFMHNYEQSSNLNSVLSYTAPAGWHVDNYTEDQVIHITSPDFTLENLNLNNSYEMIPKQGVLITMKVHDRIDKHFTLQELSDWMQTQGEWKETNQVTIGGIPAIHTFGKYRYPGVEGKGLPALDDWYQSDEIKRTYFFDIRISYAGSDVQANALRNKYKSQIDQFLQSVSFKAISYPN